MHTHRRLLLAATSLLLPALASAHPGHEVAHGALAGLLHPVQGIDHLAAALVVGLWAAQRGGRLRFALPVSFVLALLAGVFAASALHVQASGVEQLIAASLLVLGALVALAWNVHWLPCLAIAAGFAFFHGLAHGNEQPAGAALAAYGAGLAATTLALALCAMAAGIALARRHAASSLRWFGAACACAGVALF
jgi:urease accessory protein